MNIDIDAIEAAIDRMEERDYPDNIPALIAYTEATNSDAVKWMIAEIRKLRDKVHYQTAVIRQQRATLRMLREELDDVRSAVERNKELDAMMKDDELMKFMQSLCRR